MTNPIHHYQDLHLRHWSMKKHLPWNNEPEPDAAKFGLDKDTAQRARDEAKREFDRTNE